MHLADVKFTEEPLYHHEWRRHAWSDLCLYYLDREIDLKLYRLVIRLYLEGDDASLRVAVGSSLHDGDWNNCADLPLKCQLGMNEFKYDVDSDWLCVRGEPNLNKIDHFTIGGTASNSSVSLWICFEEIFSSELLTVDSIGRNVAESPVDRQVPGKAISLLDWTLGLFTNSDPSYYSGCPEEVLPGEYLRDVTELKNSFPREYWAALERAQEQLNDFLLKSVENKIGLNHVSRVTELIQLGLNKINIIGSRIIEIGCGGTNPLAVATLFYLNGASECWAVDVEPLQNESHAARGVLRLLNDAIMHPKRWNISGIPPRDFSYRISQCDLAALASGDLYGGIKNLPLQHIVGSLHDLPESSFDFLYSIDVLEHVDFYRVAARKLASILAPGGVMCHHVDFSDHSFVSGRAPHRWGFLVTNGGTGGGINRVRLSQWMDAFDKAGLAALEVVPVMEEPPVGVFDNLAPQYIHLSHDDIRTLWATLVYQAPGGAAK